jgi:hypothetical protein
VIYGIYARSMRLLASRHYCVLEKRPYNCLGKVSDANHQPLAIPDEIVIRTRTG